MFNSAFWNDFVSTLTGAIIGIPVALWLANFQKNIEQRSRKSKILTLLEEELLENIAPLQPGVDWPGDVIERNLNLLAYIKVKHWNAFSDGGELSWIQNPRLLCQITGACNDLKMIQGLCDKYFVLIPLDAFPESKGSLEKINTLIEEGIKKGIHDSQVTVEVINQYERALSMLNWYERLTRRNAQN